MIAKSLKLSKSLLRDQMSYLNTQATLEIQAPGQLEEITKCSKQISPALDMVDGTMFMTVQRLMRNPDTGSPNGRRGWSRLSVNGSLRSV